MRKKMIMYKNTIITKQQGNNTCILTSFMYQTKGIEYITKYVSVISIGYSKQAQGKTLL